MRLRENSFRAKFEGYIRTDPSSPDRKRKPMFRMRSNLRKGFSKKTT
jgi:hypothetical protein